MLHQFVIAFSIILLEIVLSCDNAAVLATIVKTLPENQRAKALKWGLGGAFLFRGLALVFASMLVKILWLKIAGGLYLMYLTFGFFKSKSEEEDGDEKEDGWFAKFIKGSIGLFWGTVVMVEIMDMVFSIDNVFAAVALTNNIYTIMGGVFVGIVAMRFVANAFIKLIEKYPALETAAYVVIGLLGIKLTISGSLDYMGDSAFKTIINSHTTDLVFSMATLVIFTFPIVVAKLKGKKTTENAVMAGGQ